MTFCPGPLPFNNLFGPLPPHQRHAPAWQFHQVGQYSFPHDYFTRVVAAGQYYHQQHGYLTPATSAMATPDMDDMERFQQLSDQYQPNLPGPLIGAKKPLSDLVTEYSQADPTFVVKTRALESTHSAYRQIKGDGQCGWRGAVFGYFEILLNSGDPSLITQELVRLRSFEETMRSAGIDYDIIIDMFDYTWELFDAIKSAVSRRDANDSVILESLNDENKSNSIVYHFKMMTSSFMQLQPDRYEAFLEMPVQQYCLTRIDPANQEIDHVGLQALTDAVIAPAYIALEVLYLDRSTGEEVTAYEFVDNAKSWPTIRLIYRPGHYDIIYKDGQAPTHVQQQLHVYLQTSAPHYVPPQREGVFKIEDPEALNELSFMFPSAAQTLPQNTLTYTRSDTFSTVYQSQQGMTYTVPGSYFPPVQQAVYQAQIPQHASTPIRSQSLPRRSYSSSMLPITPQILPSPQSPQPPSPLTPGSMVTKPATTPKPNEPQIRLSENCYHYTHRGNKSIPLDPANHGASALSTAHYTNSEFQPEMWTPEEEHSKHN